MKRKYSSSIVSILLLLLLTAGCTKDYLDTVPVTNPIDENAFDTKERVVAQVNGLYTQAKTGAFLGGRYFVYNDVRCDQFIPKSSNLVTNFATWNHTVLSSTNEVQNLWAAVYQTINSVNLFLDGLDQAWSAGKLDGKITEDEKNNFKGEALALRAICYFDLMQLYAKPYNMGGSNPGLPLRLTGNKSSEPNNLARSTVAEVYTQILADLNAAEPLVPANYSTALLNTTRIHRNTIIAFKTRVYLHMWDWNAVVTEGNRIVSNAAPFTAASGVAFAINPSYSNIFAAPYTSAESILSMPMTATNNPGTQNGLCHYYVYSSSESYYLVTVAGSAYAAMNSSDARKTMLRSSSGRYYLTKWPDNTTRTDYPPVMRYAEVLLNLSEALVRNGGAVTQRAVDLLNAVRTRSYPAGAYTLASFATVNDFYTAILMERNIEFLGEGLRNMDLMRLSLPIPAKNGGSMGNVSEIPTTSSSYIWPISGNEITFNKLMTGND